MTPETQEIDRFKVKNVATGEVRELIVKQKWEARHPQGSPYIKSGQVLPPYRVLDDDREISTLHDDRFRAGPDVFERAEV